jgi:hypothetical protein
LPTDVRGVERLDDRRVISGIVHVLKSGCRCCDCPPEYGPPPSPQSLSRSRRLDARAFPQWPRGLVQLLVTESRERIGMFELHRLGHQRGEDLQVGGRLRLAQLRDSNAQITASLNLLREPRTLGRVSKLLSFAKSPRRIWLFVWPTAMCYCAPVLRI